MQEPIITCMREPKEYESHHLHTNTEDHTLGTPSPMLKVGYSRTPSPRETRVNLGYLGND